MGGEELAYRQAVRNIDRILERGGGRIRRKDRAEFGRYLCHENGRVRRYAEELQETLRQEARLLQELRAADEAALEEVTQWGVEADDGYGTSAEAGCEGGEPEEIPF